MTIGLLKLALFIQDSGSLKEKRRVLHSLKARLHNNFNIALTQIGDEDKWQRAAFAIVGVGRTRDNLNRVLSGVINFVRNTAGLEIINYEIELF